MAQPVEFARYYADLGWQVMPLHWCEGPVCSCQKPKCTSKGKHPLTQNGLLDATDIEEDINQWWDKWPKANIGLRTGEESGFWALDVDPRHGGDKTFAALVDEHGAVEAPCSLTGGGGIHYLFAWDQNVDIRSRQNVAEGLDVRGANGYIVAPGSIHEFGTYYRWAEASSPSEIQLSLAPSWLSVIAAGGGEHAPPATRDPDQQLKATSIPQKTLDEKFITEIKSALSCIPGVERQDWLEVGMALHTTDAFEQAFDIWDEWSRAHGKERGNYDAGDQATVWNSFSKRPREITMDSLFARAYENGWVAPQNASGMIGVDLSPTNGTKSATFDPLEAPWESPTPMAEARPVEKFPIEKAIPESLDWFRGFAAAVAIHYQVPIDVPILVALPIASVSMAKKYRIDVRKGWHEPAALWTIVAMASGERKSSVLRELLAPVRQWEAAHYEKGLDVVDEHKEAIEVTAAELKSVRGRMKKGEELGEQEVDLRTQLRKLRREMPGLPRVLATDTTNEALLRRLSQNSGRILITASESDPLDVALGRYTGTPNFGVWLAGHSGDDWEEDRITRENVSVKDPALSVAIMAQPMALRELFGSPMAVEKGFISRFLLSIPKSFIGTRAIDPPAAPYEFVLRWHQTIQWLLDRPTDRETSIYPSDDARALLLQFVGALEPRFCETDIIQGSLASWYSKLPGAVMRIAGTLHAMQIPKRPDLVSISLETMTAALSWVPYLESHVRATITEVGTDPIVALARSLIAWMPELPINVDRRTFSRREAFNRLRGLPFVTSVESIDPAIELLIDEQWIRPLPPPAQRRRGRPPGPRYLVRPDIADLAEREGTNGTV